MHDDPPLPSRITISVAPAFDDIVSRALAKDPANRFSRARDFADALRAAYEDRTQTRSPSLAAVTSAPKQEAKPEVKASEFEIGFWRSIQDANDPAELELYLEQFPEGAYAKLARHKLAKLRGAEQPNSNENSGERSRLAEQERARIESDEMAKRVAAEAARGEAEENARREAEAKARAEAEAKERAEREAEAKAKRDAEEAATKEAEEQAKREGEEKAKRAAEEQARREAEEMAQREAEARARAEAEEAARKGAHRQHALCRDGLALSV